MLYWVLIVFSNGIFWFCVIFLMVLFNISFIRRIFKVKSMGFLVEGVGIIFVGFVVVGSFFSMKFCWNKYMFWCRVINILVCVGG